MDGTLWRALVAAAMVIGSAMGYPCRSAKAQILVSPRARQGYYFTLGYSVFGAEQWAPGRPRELTRGGLLTYGLGQMLTDRWGLGFRAEGGGGAGAEAGGKGRTWETFGFGLDAQFNPVSNLALHLGLGVGVDSVTDPLDLENHSRAGYGSAYSLGASWDLFFTHRLTGGWSLAPTVMIRYVPTDSLRGLWLCGGVQLGVWSGKPRNQLILPDSEAFQK
jgi:hypothetical protein